MYTQGVLFTKFVFSSSPFYAICTMEILKKIALVVGAFVIAGFILKIIFGIISMIFSIKGLILIAAIGIPIYLIAEKKFLR